MNIQRAGGGGCRWWVRGERPGAYVPIEMIGDQDTVLDIHATLADGTRIDIEMQMKSQRHLLVRIAFELIDQLVVENNDR